MIISCPECNSQNVKTINEDNKVAELYCIDCGYVLNQDDCARLLLAELDSQSQSDH